MSNDPLTILDVTNLDVKEVGIPVPSNNTKQNTSICLNKWVHQIPFMVGLISSMRKENSIPVDSKPNLHRQYHRMK